MLTGFATDGVPTRELRSSGCTGRISVSNTGCDLWGSKAVRGLGGAVAGLRRRFLRNKLLKSAGQEGRIKVPLPWP